MRSLLSNDNTFVHSGTVSRITGDSVFVSLEGNIHCDSCKVKSACGLSETTNKVVEMVQPNESFRLNENVRVVIRKDQGMLAVFWAYILPFVLLVGSLILASLYLAEWQAGVLALLVLLPYYGILYSLNSFFRRKFRITVLKLI